MRDVERAFYAALHAGPWRDVSQNLRNFYALACLLLAETESRTQGDIIWETENSWADRGLIFGGPDSPCAAALRDLLPPRNLEAPESSFKPGNVNPPELLNALREESIRLSLDRFLLEFLNPRIPVVIRGLVSHWSGVRKWGLRHFWMREFGNRLVPVESGEFTGRQFSQSLVSVSALLESFETDRDLYLTEYDIFAQIPELEPDVYPLPDFCLLGDSVRKKLFFGPAGKHSPLHTDPEDNLLAVVFGKKYVKLFSPEDTQFLSPNLGDSLLGNTTLLPGDLQVDELEFPGYSKARGLEAILGPGDVLFIPKGWWHFVKNLEISANIALFFN